MSRSILLCSFLCLLAVLLAAPPQASACQLCTSDPTTGGLQCDPIAITGGCGCKIFYYPSRPLWQCAQCGACWFCCILSCNASNCDPNDPNCQTCQRPTHGSLKPASMPITPAPAWLMSVGANNAPLVDVIALVDDPEFADKLGLLADQVQARLINGRCPTQLHGKIRETWKQTYEWVAFDLSGGGTMIQIGGGLHWVQPAGDPKAAHAEIKDVTQVRSLTLTDKAWTYRIGPEVKHSEPLQRMRYVSPETPPAPLLSMFPKEMFPNAAGNHFGF